MAAAAGLPVVEARLRAILAPYEGRLEWATIYGIPTLRRAGSKGHQWFAFVKPGARQVGFFLLPVHTYPELAASLSPALAKRRTGESVFNFRTVDEAEMAELEDLVARAFDRYMAEPASG